MHNLKKFHRQHHAIKKTMYFIQLQKIDVLVKY